VLDGDDPCWKQVDVWVDAVRVAHTLSHNSLGVMRYYYNGMLDIYIRLEATARGFGGQVQNIEMDGLAQQRHSVSDDAIAAKFNEFQEVFDPQPDCAEEELRRAARARFVLDALVEQHRLGAIAYFYCSVPGMSTRT
jgi:L-arabinose isomerase